MKNIFVSAILMAVPVAFAQSANQADSCAKPTEYHPPGSNVCVPCNAITNQAVDAEVYCTVGDEDRKFNENNVAHCAAGYYADTSGDEDSCVLLTKCVGGSTYETKEPTKNSDRVCTKVSDPCDTATTYQTRAPTLLLNRVCTSVTACGKDEYISDHHVPVGANGIGTDRTCTARTECVGDEYQTNADPLGGDVNRECTERTKCDSNTQYQTNGKQGLGDLENRVCAPLTKCGLADVSTAGVDNYQTTEPTLTDDRVCAPLTTCDPDTEFQSTVPSPTQNRVCTALSVCEEDNDEYISKARTVSSDRECTARTKCSSIYYQSNGNEQGELNDNENRECTRLSKACSLYTPKKLEVFPATALSDVECRNYTECDVGVNYESKAPTDTNDRVCGYNVTEECTQTTDDDGWITGQYRSKLATAKTDIVCSSIDNCPPGYYQSVAPNATHNRVCAHKHSSACDTNTEFESKAPTALADRECTILTKCVQGVSYQTKAPTFDGDRNCGAVAYPCDGVNEYESRAPTLTDDRECSQIAPICNSTTEYQSVAPNATTNRVCADINVCDGVTTFEPAPAIVKVAGQYKEQRTCAQITDCVAGQYQVNKDSAPSATEDRVCANWTVCGPSDVSTARDDNYQTTAPSPMNDRVCTNQPPACTASEYESVIGDADNKRVCLSKKLSCPPGQFLIKSVDRDQQNNIDNQCHTCPESLITNVFSTSLVCEDICSTDANPININTVSTRCSIVNDANGDPLLNLENKPVAYTSADKSKFDFSAFTCQMGYYINATNDSCDSCLDPEAGFKKGTNVVCTDPSDVQSFICDPGFYIVYDSNSGQFTCAADTQCDNNNEWTQLPVSCDLPANTGSELCIGVHARVCTQLTDCNDDEIEQGQISETNGIKTSDRTCIDKGLSGCGAGQYFNVNECKECVDDITNVADRALATECEKVGAVIKATACKQGFKISSDKCVFDTGVEEHNINPSSNCKFQKLSDIFDFEWSFVHDKATNAAFGTSLKFKDFRQASYYLGKTTATFNLKQFATTKDSYKYFSIANSTNSADYKNFAKTEISSATQVFDVICFVKPAYPDLLSNTYQTVNIAAQPYLSEGCTEIQYITPFTYDPNDPEWTQLTSTPVVSASTPASSQYQKSVGVSSKCGTAPQTTIHDVFAWSTLKTTYNELANFKLEINLSDLGLGGTAFGSPFNTTDLTVEGIEFEGNVEVFDLLYISGDYTSEDKVGTSAVDSVIFTDVIAPNGPHNSGDVKIEGNIGHKCSVDLSVTSPNNDFHCFDSTGIQARVSNSYTSTHLNQGTSVSTCTAALSSSCVPTINVAPTITDSRKCLDDETYGAECSTALTDITVQALKTEIGVKSVIIDAIRLRDTHQFPKGHASGTFDANAFGAKTTEFNCDDAACSSDPYIVLEESSGTYSHTCKWSSPTFAETPTGAILTNGALANGNDHVFSAACAAASASAGSISTTSIRLPGKIFPQFYVYGITTFSKSPTTGGLPNTTGGLPNTIAIPNTIANTGSRRLGSRYSPKLETKTVFVVSPQRVVSK
jgi:hypothetical protein